MSAHATPGCQQGDHGKRQQLARTDARLRPPGRGLSGQTPGDWRCAPSRAIVCPSLVLPRTGYGAAGSAQPHLDQPQASELGAAQAISAIAGPTRAAAPRLIAGSIPAAAVGPRDDGASAGAGDGTSCCCRRRGRAPAWRVTRPGSRPAAAPTRSRRRARTRRAAAARRVR